MKQFVFLLLIYPSLALASAQPYFTLHTFTYSEPVTLQGIINSNSDSFTGGENALTHNWAEVGVTYNNFGVGILGRYDYDLQFSEDTAEFYYLIDNKKPLPQGREFNLSLDANNTQSEGVRFSYTHTFQRNSSFNIGLSYLRGIWLTDGSAQGRGVALSESDYDFQFDVDYYYSEDILFERNVESPDGEGYSIDFSMDWEITPKFGFNLRVIDLIGRMYWQNAPQTIAVASSDNKTYDSNGYLIYNPILSGYETTSEFTQELEPQIKALINYKLTKKFAALGQIYSFYATNFYQLGVGYTLSRTSALNMLYMFETNAIAIGYNMKYFEFSLASDALDFSNANTLVLSINVANTF